MPTGTSAAATAGRRTGPTVLDARYGRTPDRRRRGRIGAVSAAAVLLAAAAAWAIWTGAGGAIGTLDVDTVAATVHDGSTSVHWVVTGRADTALVCAIEARDGSAVVVGLVEQAVPVTGSADRAGETLVRTVRRASTGLIVSCRDA